MPRQKRHKVKEIPQANTEMNLDAMKFRENVKEEYRKYVAIIAAEKLPRPVKTEYVEKYGELICYLEKRYRPTAG